MADDNNDTSFEVLENSCRRTLHQLTVRAESCAEGNVDAARDMASAETEGSGVKEQSFVQVQCLLGPKPKNEVNLVFFFFF